MPTSTRIMKMREMKKRKEVMREYMKRVRVAILILDFEGSPLDRVGSDPRSGDEVVERIVVKRLVVVVLRNARN